MDDPLLPWFVDNSSSRLTVNDPTLPYNTTLRSNEEDDSRYRILLTNYNWNHPNTTLGLQYARSTRQRELLQAVIHHPRFDSSLDWSRIVAKTLPLDSSIRYYIFLDVETCFESNYPTYAGLNGFEVNADRAGGRAVYLKTAAECYNLDQCHYITHVLGVIRKYPSATLVVPECRGNGPPVNYRSMTQTSQQLSIVSLSSHQSQLLVDAVDQGLPPPAIERVRLTRQQLKDLDDCNMNDRPYLMSFIGNTNIKDKRNGRARRRLVRLLKEEPDMFLHDRVDFVRLLAQSGNNTKSRNVMDYIAQSQFSAVPRGDNLFSYRFTEVLSVGAIPVVLADGWVLPFTKTLVDWSNCVVTIPEDDVLQIPSILRSMSRQEQCRRRKTCYEYYVKYMATPAGTIQGIIEGLELTRNHRP